MSFAKTPMATFAHSSVHLRLEEAEAPALSFTNLEFSAGKL